MRTPQYLQDRHEATADTPLRRPADRTPSLLICSRRPATAPSPRCCSRRRARRRSALRSCSVGSGSPELWLLGRGAGGGGVRRQGGRPDAAGEAREAPSGRCRSSADGAGQVDGLGTGAAPGLRAGRGDPRRGVRRAIGTIGGRGRCVGDDQRRSRRVRGAGGQGAAPAAPHAGSATIVCDGSNGYRVDMGGWAGAPCGIAGCVRRHEEQHIADWQGRWPNGCKNKKNGDTIPLGGAGYAAFLKASECRPMASNPAASPHSRTPRPPSRARRG